MATPRTLDCAAAGKACFYNVWLWQRPTSWVKLPLYHTTAKLCFGEGFNEGKLLVQKRQETHYKKNKQNNNQNKRNTFQCKCMVLAALGAIGSPSHHPLGRYRCRMALCSLCWHRITVCAPCVKKTIRPTWKTSALVNTLCQPGAC